MLALVALVGPASATTSSTTTTTSTTAKTATTTKTTQAPPKRPAPTTTTTIDLAAKQRADEIDLQLRSLRSQVEEASGQEADLLDRVDETSAKRRTLEGQVAGLDAEITRTQSDLDTATNQFDAVSGDLQRAEAKFAATEVDLGGAREELADRAVRAYVHQPAAQVASVLLERQSFRELAATRAFLRSFVDSQVASVARYQALREGLAGERSALQALRDEVSAQRDVVAGRRQQLVTWRARQDALRLQAAGEQGRQEALLREVKSRVKEFEGQIAALKKESDNIASLLRARQAGQKLAPSGKGVLAAPADGAITSTFGLRMHPIFHTMRMHTGVDFAGDTGAPIRAAADGVVVVAGDRGGYGNAVILDHGGALATLYAHQSRIVVSVGQAVTRGTVIGYIGATGFATGPHLHFEVRVDGNPVDPLRYL